MDFPSGGITIQAKIDCLKSDVKMEATIMIQKLTILIAIPCDESSDESYHAGYSYLPINIQACSIAAVDKLNGMKTNQQKKFTDSKFPVP